MWWPSDNGILIELFKRLLSSSVYSQNHHLIQKLNWKIEFWATQGHWKSSRIGLEWRYDFDSCWSRSRMHTGLASFHLNSKFSPIHISLKQLSNSYIPQRFSSLLSSSQLPSLAVVLDGDRHLIQASSIRFTLVKSWNWDPDTREGKWKIIQTQGMRKLLAGGHGNHWQVDERIGRQLIDKERENEHVERRKRDTIFQWCSSSWRPCSPSCKCVSVGFLYIL